MCPTPDPASKKQSTRTAGKIHSDERSGREGDDVLVEVNAGVAKLTLNRPDKHNAFDDKIIATLTTDLETLAKRPDVRVLVLQAKGKSFCAGADLNWMKRMAGYSEQENNEDALKLANMLSTLYYFPKPTIARIHGAVFGGAVGLVACCDIAIASKLSKFCMSEVKLGLIPATISPFVIEAMGERIARRYALTAEVFSSRRARRLGLIHESVNEEELDERVADLCAAISLNGPHAVSQTKRLFHNVKNRPIDEQLAKETSHIIANARVSDEGQEGLASFFNKQPPYWRA